MNSMEIFGKSTLSALNVTNQTFLSLQSYARLKSMKTPLMMADLTTLVFREIQVVKVTPPGISGKLN